MTVNEKRIPANKIVSIFEQKHEERTSKTIANFMLGFIGALAGMVLTTYVEQYEHYKQEKRQERKERETDEETERTRDSKSSQTNEQKRLE
jgi:sortase (surface protein transpeptidase)